MQKKKKKKSKPLSAGQLEFGWDPKCYLPLQSPHK